MHLCVFHNDSAKVQKIPIQTKFFSNYFSIIFEQFSRCNEQLSNTQHFENVKIRRKSLYYILYYIYYNIYNIIYNKYIIKLKFTFLPQIHNSQMVHVAMVRVALKSFLNVARM